MQFLDFIRVTEIPKKHIVKRWTRDARDVLPAHLMQYQRDNAQEKPSSFRHFNMYKQAMELVRMGDSSVAAYDRLTSLFNHCAAKMKPYTDVRDGASEVVERYIHHLARWYGSMLSMPSRISQTRKDGGGTVRPVGKARAFSPSVSCLANPRACMSIIFGVENQVQTSRVYARNDWSLPARSSSASFQSSTFAMAAVVSWEWR